MGVRTTNIDTSSLVDELIANRDGSTVRQTVSALGTQLVASGPVADRLGEIDTAINDLDASSAPQAELDELDARVGTLEGSAATQTEVDGIDGRVSALEAEGTVGYQFAAGGPVACATSANITLSGEQTIDGVLTSTSRVLVRAQTGGAENGIYVSAAGAWARAADMDSAPEVANTAVFVAGGSIRADTIWITYSEVTTLDTDAIIWIEGPSSDGAVALLAAMGARVDTLEDAPPLSETMQIIGVVVDPANGSNPGAGVIVSSDLATETGAPESVAWYASSSASITVRRARLVDKVFTPVPGSGEVLSGSPGLNTGTLTEEYRAGEAVWIEFGSADVDYIARTTNHVAAGNWTYVGGPVPATVDENPNASLEWQVQVKFKRRGKSAHEITLATSSRMTVLGDSIVEGKVCLRNKGWVARVSEMTGLVLSNRGVSGDEVSDGLPDLQSDRLINSALSVADQAPETVLIAYGTNDAIGTSVAVFMDNLRKMAEIVRGMGARPVLLSPHVRDDAIPGFIAPGMGTIYQAVAEMTDADYVDVTSHARRVDTGAAYLPMYDGVHPGTRTAFQIAVPVLDYARHLPVTQSIKVFKLRPGYSVATARDLLYHTAYERVQRFAEISVGGGALLASKEAYVDSITSLTVASDTELHDNDYDALQSGQTLALAQDWALVEITFPALARDIQRAEIALAGLSGATVYVPDIRDEIGDDEPTGDWRSAPLDADGVVHLSALALRYAMRQDVLPVLIYQSGGFSAFGAPVVRWWGARGKPVLPAPRPLVLGAEALPVTDVSDGTGWTQTGAPTIGAPADGMLPMGSTGRAVVDAGNYLSQAVTWPADSTRGRSATIELLARNFPAIQDHTAPDGALDADTCDWGQLELGIITDAGTVWQKAPVGLWWQPLRITANIPLGSTGCTLAVRGASGVIEFARASMRIEV